MPNKKNKNKNNQYNSSNNKKSEAIINMANQQQNNLSDTKSPTSIQLGDVIINGYIHGDRCKYNELEYNRLLKENNELKQQLGDKEVFYKLEVESLHNQNRKLHESNEHLKKEIERLTKENEQLRIELAEKDKRIYKLEQSNIEINEKLNKLIKENENRNAIMVSGEAVMAFERTIIQEIFGENSSRIIFDHLINTALHINQDRSEDQLKSSLTQEQQAIFDKINNEFKIDFPNGIEDINFYLKDFKYYRNNSAHDEYKSSTLTVDDLKQQMDLHIDNYIDEQNMRDDYKFVAQLVRDKLFSTYGKYPFRRNKMYTRRIKYN